MPNKFDADLLRVRQVRVTLRVQVQTTCCAVRPACSSATAGARGARERFIPDQEIRFDVSPRNMNLGR